LTKKVLFKVYHTHTNLEKNVECEPIDELDATSGFVFRCPACNTEIVVELSEVSL
jgi:hypothetical protein